MEDDSDELYEVAVNFADRYFQENSVDLGLEFGSVSVYNLENGYLSVRLFEGDVLVEVGDCFDSSPDSSDVFRDLEYRSSVSDLDDVDSVFEYLRDNYESLSCEDVEDVHFPGDEPVIDDLLRE